MVPAVTKSAAGLIVVILCRVCYSVASLLSQWLLHFVACLMQLVARRKCRTWEHDRLPYACMHIRTHSPLPPQSPHCPLPTAWSTIPNQHAHLFKGTVSIPHTADLSQQTCICRTANTVAREEHDRERAREAGSISHTGD